MCTFDKINVFEPLIQCKVHRLDYTMFNSEGLQKEPFTAHNSAIVRDVPIYTLSRHI